MVSLAGTCFIHRDRRTALRGVHSTLAAHLATGQSVCIFPEGTTSDGAHVLPFHAGLLQAAIEASVPLQPMRLDYSSQAAAYVGDITLLGSVARIVCAPNLFVTVRCLPCIAQEGCMRQELALLAHERITSAKNSPTYESESSATLFR
jgi:1-acyl-sn-glycerol-3-phosphate acyltransferase